MSDFNLTWHGPSSPRLLAGLLLVGHLFKNFQISKGLPFWVYDHLGG